MIALPFDGRSTTPDLSLRARLAPAAAFRLIGEDLLAIADCGRLSPGDAATARASARNYLASADRGNA